MKMSHDFRFIHSRMAGIGRDFLLVAKKIDEMTWGPSIMPIAVGITANQLSMECHPSCSVSSAPASATSNSSVCTRASSMSTTT